MIAKHALQTDVEALGNRARQHIDEGAGPASYDADREAVLKLLSHALPTENDCVLRYRPHHFMTN